MVLLFRDLNFKLPGLGVLLMGLSGFLSCQQEQPAPSGQLPGIIDNPNSSESAEPQLAPRGGVKQHESIAIKVATSPTQFIVMGDSISEGVGASHPTLSYPQLLWQNRDSTYRLDQTLDLQKRFPSLKTFVNLSVGGATTETLLNEQLGQLKRRRELHHQESIVVVSIGGNDLSGVQNEAWKIPSTLRKAKQRVRDLKAELNQLGLGNHVYLFFAYDPTDGQGTDAKCFTDGLLGLILSKVIKNWASEFRDLAKQNQMAYADTFRLMRGHGLNYQDFPFESDSLVSRPDWMADCIHPNDEGHNQIRRLLFDLISGHQ